MKPRIADHRVVQKPAGKPDNESRRKLVGALSASGVLATGFALPKHWTKPMVESLVVPAHAQLSSGEAPSDERLKVGVELISTVRGVNFYRWNWSPLAEKALGLSGSSLGVIAQEVRERFPGVVGRRNGFLTVNYHDLISRMARK